VIAVTGSEEWLEPPHSRFDCMFIGLIAALRILVRAIEIALGTTDRVGQFPMCNQRPLWTGAQDRFARRPGHGLMSTPCGAGFRLPAAQKKHYLRTVLAGIDEHPISRIADLLPGNLASDLLPHASQAACSTLVASAHLKIDGHFAEFRPVAISPSRGDDHPVRPWQPELHDRQNSPRK